MFRKYLVSHEKIIGFLGTFMAVVMFLSLIEVFLSNLHGQTHIFIQPIATFINGCIWCLYAYARRDKYVFIANVPGIILGLVTAIAAFL